MDFFKGFHILQLSERRYIDRRQVRSWGHVPNKVYREETMTIQRPPGAPRGTVVSNFGRKRDDRISVEKNEAQVLARSGIQAS